MIRTPAGLAVAPVRDGEVLSPEEIEELSPEEQEELQAKVEEVQEELQEILQQVPSWQHDMQEKLDELNCEMADFAVGGLIDELREKYADFPDVFEHFDAVQEDVVENCSEARPRADFRTRGRVQELFQ